ncbi:hypothetical protein F0562_009770 [Nyssa sinensis]|uniref:Protein kinase domain-containing protein n=1 Tax=Nyssa sinensis TaxID=561372 RepID=A0A5J5A1Z1_9ASTE|nr:hypothetical protein F0562_009770 [Nyssa sinensis]
MAAVRLLTSHLFFFLISLSISPPCLSIPDYEALLKFKKSITDAGALDSWKPTTSPCNNNAPWVGVRCLRGIVTGLHLGHMGLSGKIDIDALHELPGLRIIALVDNSFSGPIPEFNRLGGLKSLYLSKNQFSGEIPNDFFSKMLSMKKLWLSENKFSGKISESLVKLPHLIELHLENNQFSGPIPSFAQTSLTSIDLSYNKLEGEVPASMSKFHIRSFQGNPGLCGKPLGKECLKSPPPPLLEKEADDTALPPEEKPKGVQETSKAGWVVLGLMVTVLLLTILIKKKREEDKFDIMGKENLDDVVEVHIPSSNRRGMESSRSSRSNRSHRSSRKDSSRKGGGDLVVVNVDKGIFGLQDLMKAAAEVLGNGGLGSAYKASMANGVSVVVKRMREMNKLSKDAFDIEMRRLGRLRHRNILTPLAYHYRKEEKLLVSEYVPKGSLLYILHGDRGISHAQLNWPTRLKIIQGVARGVGFLHSEFATYELPHGNLKSSNVLLDSNYEPLLGDYALYPLINNTQASQTMFSFKSPEAILYQQVSPKSDVYCLGIIILEVITGKFPSQYLNNQKGGTDVVQWVKSAISEKRETELIDPDIVGATNSLGQMKRKTLPKSQLGSAKLTTCIDRRRSACFLLPSLTFSNQSPNNTTPETRNHSEAASSSTSVEEEPRQYESQTPKGTRPRPEYQDEQARLLNASLRHVNRLGWTEAAMIAGARDVGVSPSIIGSFPRKEAALVEFFMDDCLQRLADRIDSGEDLSNLIPSERITKLVRIRLEMQAPYISKWPQALSIQAHPLNVPTSFKQRAMLVDDIWHAAGDEASDVDWYMKRAALGAIYSATEVYMLTDSSPDFNDTWVFLNGRVKDVFDMKNTIQEVKYLAETVGAGMGSSLQGFMKRVLPR